MLPFTRPEFFEVFAAYNRAVWPGHLLILALAVAAVGWAVRRQGAAVGAVLAVFWAWMGVAYHALLFSRINPAAWLFAALFLLQAALFLVAGPVRRTLDLGPPRGWRGVVGAVLIVYGVAVYPVLGLALSDHGIGELPVLGVPCPTTILTFGLLFWARRLPRYLLPVPLVWAAIGSTAAVGLGVPQDYGLAAAGLAGLALLRPGRPAPP